MTPSADLQAEVLERMATLGAGRKLRATVIAAHGEPRSYTAVWHVLAALYERGVVAWWGEDVYQLPAPIDGRETHDQLVIGED